MAIQETSLAVLHVARNPLTGVWSLMKSLAKAQKQAGYWVGLGLLLTRDWPYWNDLDGWDGWIRTAASPRVPGSAAFLYHEWFANPIGQWLKTMNDETHGCHRVIHSHNAWLSGAFFRSLTGVDLIATFHGVPGESRLQRQPIRRSIHRRWAQALRRRGCRLVSVDGNNLAAAERLFGLNPSEFHVVPNGVESSVAECRCEKRSDIPLVVGHVGILNDDKGWRLTAKAVRTLSEQGANIRFVVAGFGPDAKAAEAWCSQHSSFASYLGHVPSASNTVMPELDVLCLPSNCDGLPMAILEAMSAGVVVVATAVGGIPSAVKDGYTGFLVPRDANAIRERLSVLAADANLLRRLGRAAHAEYLERFTLDRMRAAYEAVYRHA